MRNRMENWILIVIGAVLVLVGAHRGWDVPSDPIGMAVASGLVLIGLLFVCFGSFFVSTEEEEE